MKKLLLFFVMTLLTLSVCTEGLGEDLSRDFTKIYLVKYSKLLKPLTHLRNKSLIKNLTPFFGHLYLDEIDDRLLSTYKEKRLGTKIPTRKNKSYSPRSINHEVSCLRSMLKRGWEWRYLREVEIKNFKKLKEPDVRETVWTILKSDEKERLIESATPSLKPIIIMALHTGMRLSEIINTSWDKLDFAGKSIFVTNTKNNKPRNVPMTNYLAYTLKNIKKVSTFVFCARNGRLLTPDGVKSNFARAKKKAGVKLRFHDLRHCFATKSLEEGMDPLTLKEILGHSSLDMVMGYVHMSLEHKQKAIAIHDQVIPDVDRILDNVITGDPGGDPGKEEKKAIVISH